MKRSWLITRLFCLLLLGVGATVILMPQRVPYSQCSELYRRYAAVDGIDATFIRDYPVNDTLLVDVTLLEAKDSAGWATLKTDFSIPDLPPDFQEDIDAGIDLISTKLIPKSPPPPSDTFPNDVLAISSLKSTITVFHVNNDIEKHAVIFHNFKNSINQ